MNAIKEYQRLSFRNSIKNYMSFDDVIEYIKDFIRKNPRGEYNLVIGTDSQVKRSGTLFVTAVVIHRVGDGAWGCRKYELVDRHLMNTHEKISYETSFSEEIACKFTPEILSEFEDIIMPYVYEGACIEKEVHLDIGDKKQNRTREYVSEMVSRVKSLGFSPRIKPDSYVASGYANRYTK